MKVILNFWKPQKVKDDLGKLCGVNKNYLKFTKKSDDLMLVLSQGCLILYEALLSDFAI